MGALPLSDYERMCMMQRPIRCGECRMFVTEYVCEKCATPFYRCPCGWMDEDCECEDCVGNSERAD